MLSYGKRVRENRVFKTDRRKKNLLILGLEDREVNTIDRELCEMKWKIFFISILAFFFLRNQISIFDIRILMKSKDIDNFDIINSKISKKTLSISLSSFTNLSN